MTKFEFAMLCLTTAIVIATYFQMTLSVYIKKSAF